MGGPVHKYGKFRQPENTIFVKASINIGVSRKWGRFQFLVNYPPKEGKSGKD